jgi:uncharacterized protein YjbI with pentapeptide repeats
MELHDMMRLRNADCRIADYRNAVYRNADYRNAGLEPHDMLNWSRMTTGEWSTGAA